MILDERNEFADGTSIAAAAGTDLIGDVIDLGAAVKDIGRGQVLYLVLQIETDLTSGGAATVNFQLASDAAAAIATDGSATIHWQSGALGFAAQNTRKRYIVPLPQGIAYERYLGVLVVTAAATTTAGAISAFLTHDVQNWEAYPDAVN